MQRRVRSALATPIIGMVKELNKYLIEKSGQLHKKLQHNYADGMLKDGALLFKYAMRQLQGKDYKKRTMELLEEIQSNAYFLLAIGGWNEKTAAYIDKICDDIAENMSRMRNAANAGTTTPTGQE